MPTFDERIEAAKALTDPNQHGNTGHGHVFPRPDGAKMRCGGPAMCKVCAADLARKPDTRALALDLAAERERLLAEIERLREALQDIAKQKKTDELVTVCDVEYADFEDGYDMCIDTARAALNQTEDET